jgi:glucose-1-phosphate thymidylyltransferase
MKLLILAAGYATRLYPLTKTTAKPLLEIAGRPMIEHVLATTEGITGLDEIFVVTNEKFAGAFQQWADRYRKTRRTCPKITVVNDHSTDDSNKLGAIGDIKLVIDSQKVDDDLLIIGGDNLFKESLAGLVAFAGNHGATLGVYDVGSFEEIKKYGSVSTDADRRITFFEEKPKNPHTTLSAMCLYYYPRAVLPAVEQYVREGNNPDQPGRLVAWIYTRQPVYAFEIHGNWLDIGSFETLEQANRDFA